MEDTITRLRNVLVEQLGLDPEKIIPESTFIEDLGADSLDTVEIIMAVEEEFGIEISDKDAEKVQTVKEAVELIDRLAK